MTMDPEKPKTRHGRRADGKTQTSVSLRKDVLAKARKVAKRQNRSLSNWLDVVIEKHVEDDEKQTGKKDL